MDKRYLKNAAIYLLSAILCVLIVAYIVYHLVNSFSSDVDTMATSVVTVSETYAVDAYIFRSEEVLYSDEEVGSVNHLFDDGTMVRKGAAVATVYSGTASDELEAQINEIERQLSIIENSSIAEDVTLSDSSSIDDRIDSLYYTIQSKINSGDIDYVLRRKDELLTLLNKRQLVLKSVDSFSSKIEDLTARRNDLTSSMGSHASTVHTPSSGYIYSDVDGYEEIFTAEAVNTFTLEDFHALTDSSPDSSANNAIGKIVTDYVWYIACELPSVHQQYYTEGEKYTVKFPYSADEEVPMDLFRIVTSPEEDTIVLIFSTGNIPDGFNYLRKQSVEIVQQSFTGYRVPVSCVRMLDGKQGVYVKEGNVAVFKEIKTMAEIDGYFIIEEQDRVNDENYADKLGLHDLVIVRGRNLYENKIIQ